MIRVKRVYEVADPADGVRILVDRLWPRGVKKEELRLDDWLKELAPSDELRKWFGHDAEKWDEFRHRYRAELAAKASAVGQLLAAAQRGNVTLLFSAHDVEHNNAVALSEYLQEAGSPHPRAHAHSRPGRTH